MKRGKRGKKNVERRRSDYARQAALIPSLSFNQRYAHEFMMLALILSDTISLLLAYGIAVWLRIGVIGDSTFQQFWNVIPLLAFFLLVYALFGLYPGVGLSPVQEMKQLMGATNTVFLLLIALTFWVQISSQYSRLMLAMVWLLALVLVQMDRWLVRIIGRQMGFWGEPVAVVGTGPEGQHIVNYLNDNLRLGMRPVLTIDGQAEYEETPLVAINRSYIRTLILVLPEISDVMQKRLIDDQRFGYHRRGGEKYIPQLILISSLGWVGSLGITAHDLDGMLGLEVRQNLLNKWPNLLKRLIDLTLTLTFVIISSPILLLIMLLIYLDSPGRIFYQQKRIGRDGRIFDMWKFRTMVPNADQALQSILDANPEKRAEWEANSKLKDDPRITRVGKFLRRFSVDEIPQLINVVKGEMSLVGPRPIFQSQLESFGEWIRLYNRVRPGMTGMWQIRGRSNISFIGKERSRLDEYYIRNWSVWLDIYILLRTVQVVLSRRGAY